MTQTVENDDLMVRLRLADPVDPEELERTIAPLRSRVMRTAIERGDAPVQPIPAGDRAAVAPGLRRERRRRRRGLSFVFAALALVAAVIAGTVFSGGSIDSIRHGGTPAIADAAVRVAEANPRLLITAPGWRVVEAKSFRTRYGQLLLSDGHHQVYLGWMPASNRKPIPDDPRVWQTWTASIDGREVRMARFEGLGLGNYFSADFPAQGGVFVFMEGAFESRRQWNALMASVRPVGVEAWLDAMPAEVLRPGTFASEAAQMLRSVDVPPGFDASAVLSKTVLTNRFQAAKKLTQAVTCGWLERWSSARRAGDEGGAREAVEAMSAARHWPVLWWMARETGYRGDDLSASGPGWSTSILAIGRQMAAGELARKRVLTVEHDRVAAVGFQIPRGASPPDAVVCFPQSRADNG